MVAEAPPTVPARSLVPGDVVWINMPDNHTVGSEQQKRRPWIVASTVRFNQGPLGLLIAVPLSTQVDMQSLPSRVRVDRQQINYQDGTLQEAFRLERVERIALCDHVRSLSERRVLACAGRAISKIVNDVRMGISFNLDL